MRATKTHSIRNVGDVNRQKKIEKYFKFLKALYELAPKGSPTNIPKVIIKKYSVAQKAIQAVADTGIMKWNGGKGPYSKREWNADVPTMEMAENVYSHIYKTKGNSLKKETKIGPPFQNDHTQAIKKVLDDLYSLMQGVKIPIIAKKLNITEKFQKRKLTHFTLRAILKLKIIERLGEKNLSSYLWKGDKPTDQMASLVHNTERKIINESNTKFRKNKKDRNIACN